MTRLEQTILWLAMLAASIGFYATALDNEFVYDDRPVIQVDRRVLDADFEAIFTTPYWWPEEAFEDKLYRPLVTASYALNHLISPEPWTFRLPNLMLHAACAVLVFALARRLFRSKPAAWIAAWLFVIHPIHSEPLNAVIGRADVAVTTLGLAALICWWEWGKPAASCRPAVSEADEVNSTATSATNDGSAAISESPPAATHDWNADVFRFHLGRLGLALLCFSASLFCKESAVTLLGLLLVVDLWRMQVSPATRRLGWMKRRVLTGYMPMLLLVVAYLVIRMSVLGTITNTKNIFRPDNPIATASSPEEVNLGEQVRQNLRPAELKRITEAVSLKEGDSPFLVRWATPTYTFAKSLQLMFVPTPLRHDYSYPAIREIKRWDDPRLLQTGAWMAGLLISIIVAALVCRSYLVAVAFFVVPYSIVSNYVVLIGTIFGERLLYPPSIGFCMAIGLLLAWVMRRGKVGPVIVMLLLAGATVWHFDITQDRNAAWQRGESLVLSVPDDERATFKLLGTWSKRSLRQADELHARGEGDEAKKRYQAATALAQRGIDAAPEAWGPYSAMAIAKVRLGKLHEAKHLFRIALLLGAGADEETIRESARFFAQQGDYRNALKQLDAGLRLFQSPRMYNTYADVLLDQAKSPNNAARRPAAIAKAIQMAQSAVTAAPTASRYRLKLARVLHEADRDNAAAAVLQQGLKVCPADDPGRPAMQRMLQDLS